VRLASPGRGALRAKASGRFLKEPPFQCPHEAPVQGDERVNVLVVRGLLKEEPRVVERLLDALHAEGDVYVVVAGVKLLRRGRHGAERSSVRIACPSFTVRSAPIRVRCHNLIPIRNKMSHLISAIWSQTLFAA
jgi:hypothetical protein